MTSSKYQRILDSQSVGEIGMRISGGEKDFRGAVLMGLDLTSLNLSQINFTRACLVGVSLSAGIESNFTRADMRNANLVTAEMERANLTRANLDGANLRGANLRGVDFSHTSLYNAILAFADLRGAKNIDFLVGRRGYARANVLLWQTTLPDGTFFAEPFLTTGYREDLPAKYR